MKEGMNDRENLKLLKILKGRLNSLKDDKKMW
jgi:hypothetical protein